MHMLIWLYYCTLSCYQHKYLMHSVSCLSVHEFVFMFVVYCYPRRLSVGMGRMFESICLFVCLEHDLKTNDPKVFKLGIGNDLGIP